MNPIQDLTDVYGLIHQALVRLVGTVSSNEFVSVGFSHSTLVMT
jgi:hypothetical protein